MCVEIIFKVINSGFSICNLTITILKKFNKNRSLFNKKYLFFSVEFALYIKQQINKLLKSDDPSLLFELINKNKKNIKWIFNKELS